MASPQKENGHSPIANEIMEALAISKHIDTAGRIILWVARNTYGWSRKSVPYNWSRIAAEIGADRARASRAGRSLLLAKLLYEPKQNEIAIQKDYERWEVGCESARGGANPHGCENDTLGGANPHPPIRSKANEIQTPLPPRGGESEKARKSEKFGDYRSDLLSSEPGQAFVRVWRTHPRREKYRAALAAWTELAPNPAMAARIEAAHQAMVKIDDWTRDGARWVPQLHKWLHDEGWTDPRAIRHRGPIIRCGSCTSRPAVAGAVCCNSCAWCLVCDEAGRESKKAPQELKARAKGGMICRQCAAGERT